MIRKTLRNASQTSVMSIKQVTSMRIKEQYLEQIKKEYQEVSSFDNEGRQNNVLSKTEHLSMESMHALKTLPAIMLQT